MKRKDTGKSVLPGRRGNPVGEFLLFAFSILVAVWRISKRNSVSERWFTMLNRAGFSSSRARVHPRFSRLREKTAQPQPPRDFFGPKPETRRPFRLHPRPRLPRAPLPLAWIPQRSATSYRVHEVHSD